MCEIKNSKKGSVVFRKAWTIALISLMMTTACIVCVNADPFRDPNVKVDHDYGSDFTNELGPAIAVDANGLYVVWSESDNIFFSNSSDNGDTWSAPVVVNEGNSAGGNPCIVTNGTHVYVAWKDSRNGNWDVYLDWSPTDFIDFSSSDVKVNNNPSALDPSMATDGVNLYVVWECDDIYFDTSPLSLIDFSSPDVMVNSDGTGKWQGDASVATDGTNAYVVWADRRFGGTLDIYFDYSPISAIDFSSADIKVNNEISAFNQYNPSIATDGTNVYIAWEDHDLNWDIFFDNSSISSIDFSGADVQVDSDAPDNTYSPSVIVDSNNVSVVWSDTRSGTFDIYFDSSPISAIDFSGADVMVNDLSSGRQLSPSSCIFGGTIFVAWSDDRQGNEDIYFSRSSDGINWLNPNINIYNPELPPTSQEYPSIACDTNGNLFAVWHDDRGGNWDIYFSMSIDGGTTWMNEIKVNDDGADHNWPSIATDGTNVYVTWRDVRNEIDGDIYFDMSPIAAVDFSGADIKVNSDGAGNWQGSPSIATDGTNVYVSWYDYRNGDPDIYFDMSPIAAVDFTGADVIVNSDGTSSDQSYQSIATDGTNVYVTWKDYRNGNFDIYFDMSPVSAIDFNGADVIVNSDGTGRDQYDPSITTDSTNIYIAWHDWRNENFDIYFDMSPITAIDFSGADKKVNSDSAGDLQHSSSIATDGLNVYVTWVDYRNGDSDIYFDMSPIGTIDFTSGDVIINSDGSGNSQYHPSIATNGTHVFVIWEDWRNGTAADIYFADYYLGSPYFPIQLYEGWNMISLPLNQSNTDLEGILASVDYVAVRCYNRADINDPWKNYHKEKVGLNDLSDIDKTMGLWVLMASDDTLIITGDQPSPTNITLKKGWNLVGYPSLTPKLLANALSSIAGKYNTVDHYNASASSWERSITGTLTMMRPGEGYWIHVNEDCIWQIDN